MLGTYILIPGNMCLQFREAYFEDYRKIYGVIEAERARACPYDPRGICAHGTQRRVRRWIAIMGFRDRYSCKGERTGIHIEPTWHTLNSTVAKHPHLDFPQAVSLL